MTDLIDQLSAHVGSEGPPTSPRHPVNEPMIAHWCDAMDDPNPCYTDERYAAASVHGGIVAPPAMLDVWDRAGLRFARDPRSPRARVFDLLDAHGFVSTVAVNSEIEVTRYLRSGEWVHNVEILEGVSPEKETALGRGHFVTTRHRYETLDGEHVGNLLFRVLKFTPGTGRVDAAADARPGPDPDPSLRPRPAINADNAFFWEGARAHELRVQQCTACGALAFPPSPRCAQCGSFDRGYLVSAGRGHLYSFAIPHYPQANGFRYPVVAGLVELDEGARIVANIAGCPRDELRVGMPLELCWLDSHPALAAGTTDERGTISLPQFRPADPPARVETLGDGECHEGDTLPVTAIPITPTLIVSGAIATRDYTAVHHDRDVAMRLGSKDLFMNINTSIGLVQRYVTNWAGPQAVVKAIRLRLGAPNYPGDIMALTGRVTESGSGGVTVAVRGANELGDHVNATVELALPRVAG